MKKNAYTLIEILLTITLVALLTYGMGVFIVKGIDAWLLLSQRNILQSEARKITSLINQKLRNIPHAIDISLADADQIVFSDHDGVSHDISLFQNGGKYSIVYNGAVLTEDVGADGLNFYYYNKNGGAADAINDIRVIRFILRFNRGGETIKTGSSCRLRIP